MASRASSNPSRSSRGDAARDRLLDVSEKLFAEKGIDAVSLNSIARFANQLNGSVMQYHFLSKTGLIEAILERRMQKLNAHRLALLAKVDTSNRARALRQIASAMVLPISEHLATEAGSYYIRFVAQVTFNAQRSVFEIARGKYDSGAREIANLLESVLSDIPREVLRHRMALVTTLVLFGFGEREKLRLTGRRTGVARLHTNQFVDDLIQVIIGALTAPIVAE